MGSIEPMERQLRSGARVLIRDASQADAPATRAFILSMVSEERFSITTPDEFTLTDEQEAEWVARHLSDPACVLIAAEADGEIVGLLNFEAESLRRRAHGGTFGVSVAADWREGGLGSVLIETLLAWARANPLLERVGLVVLGSNARAIHVYQRLGFIEEGRRPRAIKRGPDDYDDEVLMYQPVPESPAR
jgi:RimJ/RimL family protein N-acetyltransferase